MTLLRVTLLRDESSSWGRCPQSPRDLSHSRQNDGARRQIARPPLIPAAESALGLRPRSALSSAQVLPEWITSTSPCNHLSANGDYPLNFVSHSRGSVHGGEVAGGMGDEIKYLKVTGSQRVDVRRGMRTELGVAGTNSGLVTHLSYSVFTQSWY